MSRFLSMAALAALLLLTGLAPAASAHVTLQPSEVPAGEFKRLDVRVPNEREDASTTRVEVKLPPGFLFVSYEPVPGWTAKIAMAKLAKPVEVHGETHAEQVDTVTFSTRGKGIQAGQFQDFGLSVGLPDRAGTHLTFKALQTYSDGEVVRWIGAPDADKPAPRVELTAAGAGGHGAAAAKPARTAGHQGDGTVSPIRLVLGGFGLLSALAALRFARRSRMAAPNGRPRTA